MSTFEQWQRILEPAAAALVAAAAELADPERPTPAQVEGLRRVGPAELAGVALELVAARRRGAAKFSRPELLLCDREGMEQASGEAEAAWKGRRFAAAVGGEEVLDLCCGIGGDAMALVGVSPLLAVDRNRIRTLMAAHNAGCPVRTADLAELDPAGRLYHLDPGRRGGGRRRHRYDDYEPGPAEIARWVEGARGGAVKLGPGVDFADLPGGTTGEIEVIGGRGGLLQAVLWTGELAWSGGVRRATRLPGRGKITATHQAVEGVANTTGPLHGGLPAGDSTVECGSLPVNGPPAEGPPPATGIGGSELTPAIESTGDGSSPVTNLAANSEPLTFSGVPSPIQGLADGPEAFIHLPDPALERAGLVGTRLGADGPPEMADGLGIVTSSEPWSDPWFTSWPVLAVMPWRPARIRQWLAAHDGGVVAVKTRGGAVDGERSQAQLRGKGSTPYVVFGLRLGRRVTAIVTRPR